jgi:DNA-binding response OmpR family regulator
VTKTVQPHVSWCLRVDSVLAASRGRWHRDPDQGQLEDGDLVVDLGRHEASLGGRVLSLTTREYDLLRFLLAHPGIAFLPRGPAQAGVGWSFGDHSTVTVHVRRLREKVERPDHARAPA